MITTQSTPRHPSLIAGDSLQEIKRCYDNELFYIDECDLGLGIFAHRDIKSGERILAFGGALIDFTETRRRGQWECMPLQIAPNVYIDLTPPGVFVNHSCDPNAGVMSDRDLVALYNISKGHEIRFDYSTTMQENSFTMECLCGSPICRGIVKDFATLPDQAKSRYLENKMVISFIVSLNNGFPSKKNDYI